MRVVELEAIYDGRKSFYSKAMVVEHDDRKELYSYGTLVVTIRGDEFFLHDDANYSDTTRRHVREFMIQYFGLGEFLTKKMIENLMDGKWHKDYSCNSTKQNS